MIRYAVCMCGIVNDVVKLKWQWLHNSTNIPPWKTLNVNYLYINILITRISNRANISTNPQNLYLFVFILFYFFAKNLRRCQSYFMLLYLFLFSIRNFYNGISLLAMCLLPHCIEGSLFLPLFEYFS